MKGFTLIELMLVTALMLALGSFLFPVSASYLQTQVLEDTVNDLTAVLRRAQIQASLEKDDSAFGVKILSDEYVLFSGDSYATRSTDEDETFALSSTLSMSGITEVVFAKLSGIPNTTGSITLSLGETSQDITINAYGKIER